MFKISKLFKGEIKKIFFGPSMIIMAGIFLLALSLCPALFSPTDRKITSPQIELNTTNVSETYSSFLSNKDYIQNELTSTKSEINTLIDYNDNFKENLIGLSDDLYSLRLEFASATNLDNEIECYKIHQQMIEKVKEIKVLYTSYMNDYFIPLLLVDEELDFDIITELDLLNNILTENPDGTSLGSMFYNNINLTLTQNGNVSRIKDYLSKINSLTYSSENLAEYLEKYSNLKTDYFSSIETEMQNLLKICEQDPQESASKNNINSMKNLALKYLYSQNYILISIKDSALLEISSNYKDGELSKYIGFENFNSYELKEELTKTNYYLDNNIIETNVANAFMYNTNSQDKTNAFDYMYFSLETISIFVVAFTVIIGAGMVAKEYSDGTMKLLAIRPYSRSKIILSKILATLFVSFIFVLIAVVMSTIIGIIIYGISFPSMLLVFNASYAFTVPVWVAFLIYIVCLMIKIYVYALLSIAISTIFKSYIVSVCVSLGIYLLNIILTFVSSGASWLKFNPFANLDLFKYFGGSFIVNNVGNNITNLFYSPVFADTSIWLTVSVIVVSCIVLNLVIFSIFKNRDIT